MNETKIEIIKKVLNVDKWTLREGKNEISDVIFIFDENKKNIVQHNKRTGSICVTMLNRKIRLLFGFKPIRTAKLIIDSCFKWKTERYSDFPLFYPFPVENSPNLEAEEISI